MGIVKIGTSGFSFEDLTGVFYPKNSTKSTMFSYYVQFFDTVEINLTFYRIPSHKVFASLENQTSSTFEFIVKLNRDATHEIKNYRDNIKALHESVSPVKEANKLSGFLAQFPYSFKNNSQNRKYLSHVKECCGDVPLFVEFRNGSWIQQAVYKYCESLQIRYCCVDEPDLKGLLPPQSVTVGDTGYIRYHGRNTGTWWDSSKGDRYDYLYNENELEEWVPCIREINSKTSKAFLFFNNCHAGHAIKNAKVMAQILKRQCGIDAILQDIPVIA